MKADLSLNIEDYEAVLYPPGTIFDQDTMVADEGGLQGDAAEGRPISVCLEPALYVHARDGVYEYSLTWQAIMRREWVFNGQGERNAAPVVKAVVVVLRDG